MKVKESEYLKIKKPILKKLLSKLLDKYEYASILANDSKSTNYRVSKTGTNISEDGTLSERGFCVKVYDNGRAAEYSFSVFCTAKIMSLFKCAYLLTTLSRKNNYFAYCGVKIVNF